jgi:hypothetical protein
VVHSSDDGNVTVVAILYRFGRPDPFLWQVMNPRPARQCGRGYDVAEQSMIVLVSELAWCLLSSCVLGTTADPG